MSAPQLGRVMTPIDYIQDDANTLDECRGMVEWCEVGTPSSRGGVLLRLRIRLFRLKTRPVLVMQLVGGWPDGPRICLYMPHILYLVAKLFEQCSCYLLMLSMSYAVIQHAIRPDMMISVIYILRTTYIPPDHC